MSIELKQAAQQAIDALNEAVAFREGGRQKAIDAVTTLRTAIQQAESEPCKSFTELRERHREGVDAELAAMAAEAKTYEPVVKNGHMVMVDSGALQMVRNAFRRDAGNGMRIRAEMLAALDAATHPAPGVPEFSRIAKRKLDELQEQGFAITGYAIQRAAVRGFIDGGGFVGWWQGEPAPGMPDDVVRDADRLNWLARNPVDAIDVFGKSRPDEARFIRATIDAAMLTAAQAQKGHQ